MPFNLRKWNILAFRGRLMSLLVLTHSGVSSRPHLPQESRIFRLLGQMFIIFSSVFLYLGSIRSTPLPYSDSEPLQHRFERKAATPRKHNPIFFVRCNAFGALLVLRE